MSVALYGVFLERQLGITANAYIPEYGDPFEVIRLLWPFRTALEEEPTKTYVRMMPYNPAGIAEFDSLLMMMAINPDKPLENKSDATLTVWHERLVQAMVVLGANAAMNEKVWLPPRELPERYRQIAAGCLWLHEMELPFTPGTVKAPALPPGRA